ncbi:MAG: hypothetical protein PVG04_12145 [Anaerolineales bacterium]|jgi:hypothetical protein
MKNTRSNLPQREVELLSAYIDGQLSDREAHRLESRLREEPELRTELDALRITAKSLRDLPTPLPRRHFTLTPEMVGARQAPRAFPVLRFATALAGLAFIALVGLEGLQSVSGNQLAARAPEMMQAAEVAEDAITTAEEPMASAPRGEEPQELEAMEVPAEQPAEEPVAEEPEALMMEQPEEEAELPAGDEQVVKATVTTDAAEVNGMAAGEPSEGRAAEQAELEGADQELGEVGAPQELPPEAPKTAYAEQTEPRSTAMLSPLRWLQVITGVLFIVLSVLTITFRKRSA